MLHGVLTNPAWLAVVIAVGALIPQVKKAGIWSWRKWRDWRNTIPTQGAKDRKNYGKLLDQYEKYLSLLGDLIIRRAQHERGPDEWTPSWNRRSRTPETVSTTASKRMVLKKTIWASSRSLIFWNIARSVLESS
jgi:hypothetical protein